MIAPTELTADNWRRAGRAMLAKALAEWSYEELLEPRREGEGWCLDVGRGVSYRFLARRGGYGSWQVAPESIVRVAAGAEAAADDPLAFLLDARERLGLSGDVAGHLVRELTATLAADARLLDGGPAAAELADMPYAELEGHQAGHPWIVPNKGRWGFSASDAARWAPEARRPLRLPWIAVRRELARYRAVPGLGPDRLYAGELSVEDRARFDGEIARRGLEAGAYVWLPVHPWQWDETILPLFAPDVADGGLVPLGESSDRYLAQQSIRTFSNLDAPWRHHVKVPLSVLNTLVWRGLPTERTEAAPAVTGWVLGLRDADPFLAEETRVVLLGEVASVTVPHRVLEALDGVPYQYRELLGAIWRQPIAAFLDGGERARTLASLLWVDGRGRALVAELVARSGLDAEAWARALCHALLPPLLHFLYRYGLVFSPHGENTVLISGPDEVPARLATKDFVDDVNLSAAPLPELTSVPADVDGILLRERPEFLCQFIQSGLFIGHFRYLAPLMERQLGLPEARFWGVVREEILAHQARFPELRDRFALFDLLAPDIERLCLNRNRLLLDGYRDRPERPHAATHGRAPNPLCGA